MVGVRLAPCVGVAVQGGNPSLVVALAAVEKQHAAVEMDEEERKMMSRLGRKLSPTG